MEIHQTSKKPTVLATEAPAFRHVPPSQFGLLASKGRRNVRLERIIAGVVATFSLALLGIAAFLDPSPSGVGTHAQLSSLGPCRWLETANMPCPTCGMTTAFAHAADGRPIRSFLTQPMGFVLALGTAIAFWIGLYVAMTGSAIGRMTLWLWRPACIWTLAGFTLLAWAYKIWIVRGGY